MLTALGLGPVLRSTIAPPRSVIVADAAEKLRSGAAPGEVWRSAVGETADVPPMGFTWGEAYVFDKDGMAVPVIGTVVSTKTGQKTLVDEVQVRSWYDAGVRLETPLPSSLARPPPTESLDASASTSAHSEAMAIDELTIGGRIGQGTQCEVRLGELPGHAGPVAVKVGKATGAVAIAREAAVLSVMSGAPGFPTLLHHEEPGPDTPGGALILGLLGSSLHDVRLQAKQKSDSESNAQQPETTSDFSGPSVLRMGRRLLAMLRQLHLAGFVHNDLKPANILLDTGETHLQQTSTPHLIDFGSCTRVAGDARQAEDVGGSPFAPEALVCGPIGSPRFASVAADEYDPKTGTTHPADDIESLVYNLAYLATGSLPWHDQPAELMAATKKKLLTSGGSAVTAALTDGVDCATTAAALEALYEEVRRCHGERREGGSPSVDYDVCMAILGDES